MRDFLFASSGGVVLGNYIHDVVSEEFITAYFRLNIPIKGVHKTLEELTALFKYVMRIKGEIRR